MQQLVKVARGGVVVSLMLAVPALAVAVAASSDAAAPAVAIAAQDDPMANGLKVYKPSRVAQPAAPTAEADDAPAEIRVRNWTPTARPKPSGKG